MNIPRLAAAVLATRLRTTSHELLQGPAATPGPIALQLEFTSDCQLGCRMCPLTTGQSSTSANCGPMQPAEFNEVLSAARSCGRVILAGYGEPLTHPDCLPMLAALDDAGVDIAMSTNGIALTPTVAAKLANLENLSLINVSIDSPDPAIYRHVRGGAVSRALRGVENLLGALHDPDRVVVSAVALASTLESLVDFPKMLAEIGVRRFELQSPMDYTDYAQHNRLLDRQDLAAAVQAIKDNCDHHGIDLQVFAPDRLENDLTDPSAAHDLYYGDPERWDETQTRVCHVPWEIPFIDKDGTLFPCCYAASQNASSIGSITTDGFWSAWTGPNFQEFRAAITDGRTTPDICRRCTVAPLGPHLYGNWAANIEHVAIEYVSWNTAHVVLDVRNTGPNTWTLEHPVRVGTSEPRDTPGHPLRHPSWITPDRPAEMNKDAAPGDTTRIQFAVQCGRRRAASGAFELVIDGMCWLPDTKFTLNIGTWRRPTL